jgi:hypothetical protein
MFQNIQKGFLPLVVILEVVVFTQQNESSTDALQLALRDGFVQSDLQEEVALLVPLELKKQQGEIGSDDGAVGLFEGIFGPSWNGG